CTQPCHPSGLYDTPATFRRGARRERHHARDGAALHRTRNDRRFIMGSGSGLACDLTLNSALPAELRERFQNTTVIRDILADTDTIAIVGLSRDRQKASHFVATYLDYAGYTIIPVNPTIDEWY